jgi:hypothetical protein
MEPIPDCLGSTLKEDWTSVLRVIIEGDKVEPHLVRIDDIFSYDTTSEFNRDIVDIRHNTTCPSPRQCDEPTATQKGEECGV